MKSAASRLGQAHREQVLAGVDPVAARAAHLLTVARALAKRLGLVASILQHSRLAQLADVTLVGEGVASAAEFAQLEGNPRDLPLAAAHRMSEALDLLQASEASGERRKTGSYFTPGPVAAALIERSLAQDSLKERLEAGAAICDPACGGGAFLIEAARQIAQLVGGVEVAAQLVYGSDLSEVALGTTEIALWFLAGGRAPVRDDSRFVCGDALLGSGLFAEAPHNTDVLKAEPKVTALDFSRAFPSLSEKGFDWIVGNPPWVAFQGRATQKITKERRAFYRKNYRAFSGYPTLHGLFIERASQLAPSGYVSLLIPSSVSDLEGYKACRETLTACHRLAEPLPEYGQDAFEGVVQPCFGLIAAPSSEASSSAALSSTAPSSAAESTQRPWVLEEKTHAEGEARMMEPPERLRKLDELPPLDPDTFREMGFQSNRMVQPLFLRADEPEGDFTVPLLEGRTVSEFTERAPRLFLSPDEETLRAAKCKLKPKEQYESVHVVVRQTAAFTIAARHGGARFRNSLIGAFETADVSADLLVGLLNSALYRALHVMRQRDARQAAFPQVKLSHLRKLPAPPEGAQRAVIESISAQASESGGLDVEARRALDDAVFELFAVDEGNANSIRAFLLERAPAALRPSR